MELFIIDAIGPFFRGVDHRRINWSKIPFTHLATAGAARETQWAQVRADFETLVRRVAAIGYNAITLDDVAHLADHAWFEPEVRERGAVLREEFRRLFAIARRHGLKVLITSDYLTTTEAIDARLRHDPRAARVWFRELIDGFLAAFPEVDGVILRIGESDGHDVTDPLRSRLMIRSAGEVRELLRTVLPVFEQHRRMLIFRTWTVGAYLIGDLIWHRGRLAQAFDGITSPALVVSMKYGESDFFRYLPLNRHFFRIDLPKIVEFQARREYEGAGEFPSFVGWECEQYERQLRTAGNVVGFSVWCQTGGWHAFRRLAFLQPEAVWIELNVAVLMRVLRHRESVEQAVSGWFGADRAAFALELLRRSDAVIRELFYIEEFARQKLFFRRVRIPPLLHVFWDCLFINDAARRVLGHFVRDPEAALRAGEAAFENFPRMRELAERLALPVEDIEFMEDTGRLLLLARRYFFLPARADLEAEILAAKAAYKSRWPRTRRQRYRIRTSFEPFQLRGRTSRWLFSLLIRRQRGYRTVLDHLLTLRVLSWIYRLFRVSRGKSLPKFIRKTAMGVDALFR
ncbi:MAG: hypothetical protein IAE82_16915 [Opitutaceae bacterium]|nr:hypothetical protein [Opitutaceae bacterium]